ncbi:MAG: hypothetical protein RL490_837 [Pseudomonadota bacterium]|jgi:hypothetical protein
MTVLDAVRLDTGHYMFDNAQATAAGAALHDRYVNADPFPHIILDNFIDPDLLRPLLAEWPATGQKKNYDRDQERLKYEWQPIHLKTPQLRGFLAEMISEPMLRFLEALTGIEKLIADPYFVGGGLHETRAGGHLGVHADFNINKQMNVVRRINLLIYLNDDWDPAWNGALELWSRDMKECKARAYPDMARAVIFNTDLDSFHGVPDPIACPPDRARRSIAMYYYTAADTGLEVLPDRTTVFKKRPGSGDATDWAVKRRHLIADWLPPVVYRAFRGHDR